VHQVAGVRTRRALLAAFVANGLGAPSFLARLPERQRDLDLSDAALGATLLGLALGALVASPAAGWAVHRVGSRAVTVASGVAIGASLCGLGAAPTAPLLFAALVVVGAADAAMDIAMNANGAAYEAAAGRSALQRLHAAWSVGALTGAALAAAAAAAGLAVGTHLVVVGVLVAGAALHARTGLVPTDPVVEVVGDGTPSRRRLVPTALVALAAATVAGAALEGIAGDWSAVQLDRLGVRASVAPLGFASFMAGMVGGRLVGDRRTDRLGGARVLRRGMALCAAGIAAGTASGEPVVFCAGLALAGFGLSGFFPLAFSSASRVPGVRAGTGTATVSLAARAGFLVEPVLVGALAEATDLRVAFAVAAAVAAALAVGAHRLLP